MKILHIGSGRKGKDLPILADYDAEIITLDEDDRLEPDIVCSLGTQAIPLSDNSIDQVVAWHVLEHIGRQGETKEWFLFWEEIYRILIPDGQLQFECPLHSSLWAWSDPSHTRALSPYSFLFFDQDSYRITGSAITPFRINCDFKSLGFEGVADGNEQIKQQEKVSHFRGVLQARKPLNPWWNSNSHD